MKTRNCPFCAEEIKLEAIKCKHCSEFLNTEEIVKIWMCEDCNEEIEDNFDACWNCSSEKRTEIIEKIDNERIISKQYKEQDNLKRKWYKKWWVWLIILFLLGSLFSTQENPCGCSKKDIEIIADTLNCSDEEALKWCCRMKILGKKYGIESTKY